MWTQWDGANDSVFANRYDVALGRWGDAGVIERTPGDAYFPSIGVDALGNATAMWSVWSGVSSSTYSNKYSAASARWGDAGVVAAIPVDVSDFVFGVDREGNATALWTAWDGAYTGVAANRYRAAFTRWDDAGSIEGLSGEAWSPQVGVTSLGRAMAVWRMTSDVGGACGIYANVYRD